MKQTNTPPTAPPGAPNPGSDTLASVTLLLDFYGELLTPRQSEVLALHCNDDLSLAEIAQELGISRQAAHDAISTGKTLLLRYEEKLRLVERFSRQRALVALARTAVGKAMQGTESSAGREAMEQVEAALRQLMEQL